MQHETLPQGTEVGSYEVLDVLGAGGFGCVYRARRKTIAGEVALKVLHAERCTDPKNVARFLDEARAANSIQNPGVAEVYDFGITRDGTHYLVMELLRGRSLAALLDERHRLPLEEALPLLRGIAEIIDAVHAAGVSHRDLKPGNIMVLVDGSVKVIDFGLAKLAQDVDRTNTGQAFGTPHYMAPEQCRGQHADARSDRYAFGALAYHVLTGTPPFAGNALAVAIAHVDTLPQRPSRIRRELPRAVDETLLALLAKDPAARPNSLTVAVEALGPARRRRRVGVRAALMVAMAGASTGAVAYIALRSSARPTAIDPGEVQIVRTETNQLGPPLSMRWDGSAVDLAAPDGNVTISWSGSRNHSTTHYRTQSFSGQWIEGGKSSYRSLLPDGRWIDAGSHGLVLFDPVSRETRTIGAGMWAEACPRGGLAATASDDRLLVLELATGAVREVATARGVSGARWSPDCGQLVWGDYLGVNVTDVAAAKTQRLALPLAGPSVMSTPAAFVDGSSLVYCGRSLAGGVSLQAHYLDGRAPDTRLTSLPPGVTACSVAASLDGQRVAVVARSPSVDVAVFDVGKTPPTRTVVMTDAAGTARVAAFGDADHLVVRTATRVERVALDGARADEPTCTGSIAMVHYRGRLAHVVPVDGGHAYRILAETTCVELERLDLPADGPWSVPDCAGEVCVGARLAGNEIVSYRLAPDVHELARAPYEPLVRDAPPYPVVAISPDARHLVVMRAMDPVYHLVGTATGEVRTLRLGRGLLPSITALRWADSTSLFLGVNTESGDAIERVDLDGGQMVIAGAGPAGGRIRLDAVSSSGTRVAVAETHTNDALLFVEIHR